MDFAKCQEYQARMCPRQAQQKRYTSNCMYKTDDIIENEKPKILLTGKSTINTQLYWQNSKHPSEMSTTMEKAITLNLERITR